MSLIDVTEAVARLKNGEAVAIPTETVYGLAARIDCEQALRSIFALKQRPFFDPLIVHVEDVAQAKLLTREWPEIYDHLCAKFWPGPLTLLALKSEQVSPLITSGLERVALRAPAHVDARAILHALQVPLAAPSANMFGKTSPTRAAHVESEFAGKVAVVDGGPCSVGVESTVLAAERAGSQWKIQILRPGGISRQQIREALHGIAFTLERAQSEASPGSLKAHYQPLSKLVLLNDKSWNAQVQSEVERRLGTPIEAINEMTLPATAQEAARTIYENLRQLSRDQSHILWIARLKNQQGEDWEAVWDRLERAASLIL